MKEIADIADSVSADGIDAQDKKLLDEIKSSVHHCLMDIVGESQNGRRKSAVKRKRSLHWKIKDETTD